MKTLGAYNRQVELMRRCNVCFHHNGNAYLLSQIVLRKSDENKVYLLYGTRTTEAGPVTHFQDVSGISGYEWAFRP